MNGTERIMRALHFEQTDRVPVIPELIQHNLEVAEKKHGEFSTNPTVMYDVIMAGLKAYETDAVYISSDNYLITEAMGSSVRIAEDDPPALLYPAAASIEEAVKLEPLDVEKGRIPVILKATELSRKELRDEIFIKTCLDSAPFSAAASLLGPEKWYINLLEEPQLCHELLELCTESVIRFGVAAAKAGAHGLAFGDSPASLVSRELYQQFALPYAQRTIKELHTRTGLPIFYHICGDTRHILDLMSDSGADCLEIDSMVPIASAKAVAYGKCAIEGNVSTVEAFWKGTPEDVKREAYAIIDMYGNKGGLILSSACEIPRHSPKENVRALTDAAINYPYKTTVGGTAV